MMGKLTVSEKYVKLPGEASRLEVKSPDVSNISVSLGFKRFRFDLRGDLTTMSLLEVIKKKARLKNKLMRSLLAIYSSIFLFSL